MAPSWKRVWFLHGQEIEGSIMDKSIVPSETRDTYSFRNNNMVPMGTRFGFEQ